LSIPDNIRTKEGQVMPYILSKDLTSRIMPYMQMWNEVKDIKDCEIALTPIPICLYADAEKVASFFKSEDNYGFLLLDGYSFDKGIETRTTGLLFSTVDKAVSTQSSLVFIGEITDSNGTKEFDGSFEDLCFGLGTDVRFMISKAEIVERIDIGNTIIDAACKCLANAIDELEVPC